MIARAAGLLALLVGLQGCGAAEDAAESAADLPNILWLTSEDMSADIGAYGDSYAETPHIDGLARQGVHVHQCVRYCARLFAGAVYASLQVYTPPRRARRVCARKRPSRTISQGSRRTCASSVITRRTTSRPTIIRRTSSASLPNPGTRAAPKRTGGDARTGSRSSPSSTTCTPIRAVSPFWIRSFPN